MQFSKIVICCVAENAMFDIFGTWNANNPDLSRVLNWSLSTNPCTDWSGVTCSRYNGSTDVYYHTDDVSDLRYVTYLVPYAYSLLKINVARPLCHDTHKFVGLDVKKMSKQMNICMILRYIQLR